MTAFRSIVWSSVGKKFITGVTGLALIGFVTVHLIGNLTLFIPDGGHAFNAYAHFLEHAAHGWLIYAFEAGLILIFLAHMISAVTVAWTDKRSARPRGYAMQKNAGGKSRKTLSSTSMILTGLLLIVFVVLHVKMFKYADHPMVTYDGTQMKDLFAVVVDAFKTPWITFGYVGVMILLGLHLRHGAWSAFQSLGWSSDRHMPLLQGVSVVLSVAMALGFLVLPLYIYFLVDAPLPGGH